MTPYQIKILASLDDRSEGIRRLVSQARVTDARDKGGAWDSLIAEELIEPYPANANWYRLTDRGRAYLKCLERVKLPHLQEIWADENGEPIE